MFVPESSSHTSAPNNELNIGFNNLHIQGPTGSSTQFSRTPLQLTEDSKKHTENIVNKNVNKNVDLNVQPTIVSPSVNNDGLIAAATPRILYPNSPNELLTFLDNTQTEELFVDCNDSIFENAIGTGPIVLNKKAIKNLTHLYIPLEVLTILSLGPNFIPPSTEIDPCKAAADIVSILDNNILPKCKPKAKSLIFESIGQLQKSKPSEIHNYINNMIIDTSKFLSNNPNLMITTSDKGNVTVILDKEMYFSKMHSHLEDLNTYSPRSIASHKAFIKINRKLLHLLKDEKIIPPFKISRIISEETYHAKMYGLIKIHKDELPIRPINAKLSTPGTKIDSLLNDFLSKLPPGNDYNIKNSKDIHSTLSNLSLSEEDRLFTFDIVNMFTNISPDLALNIILNHKDFDKYIPITKNTFSKLFHFTTVTNTEFMFGKQIYKQIRGLFMGASSSPIIARIVTDKIIDQILPMCGPIKLIKKYVDDMLIITDEENALVFMNLFNSFDPNIKVTCNKEIDNSLSYLDMTLYRENNKILSKWYSKPYSSGRLVNFYSDHEDSIIINTAVSFVNNMFSLSHNRYHKEIDLKAQEILHLNSFPDQLIRSIIQKATTPKECRDLSRITEFRGLSAPSKLIKNINRSLFTLNPRLKIAQKTLFRNLSYSFYHNPKAIEDLEYRNNIVIKSSCFNCQYFTISPITTPLVVLSSDHISINDNRHPLYTINMHTKLSHHTKFSSHIIYECSTRKETLISSLMLCTKFNKPTPIAARGLIDRDLVLKLLQ